MPAAVWNLGVVAFNNTLTEAAAEFNSCLNSTATAFANQSSEFVSTVRNTSLMIETKADFFLEVLMETLIEADVKHCELYTSL